MELMNQQQSEKRSRRAPENVETSSTARFMGKVFLYMFIGLLISAIFAGGTAALLLYVLEPQFGEQGDWVYIWTMIGSAFGLLIVAIWANFGVFRHKTRLIYVPFILYSVFLGILCSSFVIFINIYDIAIAFGITCLCFATMGLVGFFSKASMKPFILVVIAVSIGLLLLTIVNCFLYFTNYVAWEWIDAIVTYGFFGVIMLITMIDMHNIRKIAEKGEQSRNLVLYCAFTLYVDFVWILIKVLSIMARSRN